MRFFGAALALFFITGILPAVHPSPRERLEEWLDGRGILWEEGFLFAGEGGGIAGGEIPGGETVDDDFAFEFSGEAAGKDGASVLVIFGGSAGTGGDGETGEAAGDGAPRDDSAPEACTVVALPLGDGTAEGAFDRRCALGLAEGLSGAALPARVIVAFLGDRDLRFLRSGGRETGAAGEEEGVSGLLSYFPDPERTVFWYLDLPEAPAELLVHHGSAGRIAPLHVVRGLTARCESLKIPFAFANPFNELLLSGFAGGPAELDVILKQEMTGVVITGMNRRLPEFLDPEKPGEDKVTELLLRLASSPPASIPFPPASIPSPPASIPPPPASIPFPPVPDLAGDSEAVREYHYEYRYRIVPYPGRAFYLSERALILLTFAAGVLFFVFIHVFFHIRGLSRFPLRIFFRCFWIIPALGIILGLSLGLSGLVTAPAGSLVPAPPFFSAFLLPCLRPVLGIGFFLLFTLPLRRYRFPRRLDLYGAGALFFAALNILAAAFVNIVLVPVLTGALIILFLGTCFKNPVPVFICAFLAPLHGISILAFALPPGGGADSFLLSTKTADVICMSLALLPFVLMYRRGTFALLARRRDRRNAALEKRPADPKKTGT